MEIANREFLNYKNSLVGQSCDSQDVAIRKYQKARSSITKDLRKLEHDKWKKLSDGPNSQNLWQHIDWKGNVSKGDIIKPGTEDLVLHFEELYSSGEQDEVSKMNDLVSDIYIPILDDPITQIDVDNVIREMKKDGYDYNLNILKILVHMMSPLLLLFFNIMFYITYPISLAKSLLKAIPKKGNLMLSKNYRGIQMLTALGASAL